MSDSLDVMQNDMKHMRVTMDRIEKHLSEKVMPREEAELRFNAHSADIKDLKDSRDKMLWGIVTAWIAGIAVAGKTFLRG